jgi:hypothetical protein
VGNSEWQETDTHWRCRNKGSFNWRMKFDVRFPMRDDDYGNDTVKVKIFLLNSNKNFYFFPFKKKVQMWD